MQSFKHDCEKNVYFSPICLYIINFFPDSTVQEELLKIGGMINRLTSDVEHLKSKSQKSTNQLQVTVRKTFKVEKALIRKLNKTLHLQQEEATKEVRDFIAKSKKSLGSHIENIGNLYNTTSNNREALEEITTKLDNTIAAMADTSIRISQNERLLTAVSGKCLILTTFTVLNTPGT